MRWCEIIEGDHGHNLTAQSILPGSASLRNILDPTPNKKPTKSHSPRKLSKISPDRGRNISQAEKEFLRKDPKFQAFYRQHADWAGSSKSNSVTRQINLAKNEALSRFHALSPKDQLSNGQRLKIYADYLPDGTIKDGLITVSKYLEGGSNLDHSLDRLTTNSRKYDGASTILKKHITKAIG